MYKIKKIKNQVTLLAMFVLFMLTMSYAAVPLYKLFCQVTGYGGTPKVVEKNSFEDSFGIIKVRFDSSLKREHHYTLNLPKRLSKLILEKIAWLFIKLKIKLIKRSQQCQSLM